MTGAIFLFAALVLLISTLFSDPIRLRNRIQEHLSFLITQSLETVTSEGESFFGHLGGNGPWIPRAIDNTRRCPLPRTCSIVQAHLISRHAERFPTWNAGRKHMALLQKLRDPEIHLRGSLSFVTDWEYFTDSHYPEFENLTATGPYAGTLQAFTTGQKLRKLYNHLVFEDRPMNFWSCGSPRDIETARHHANGFFGGDWETANRARLHVISESGDRGGDTLTPGRSCRRYRDDQEHGREVGYSKLAEFQIVMAKPIIQRLAHDAGGLLFTALEIYSMMELCGFEVLVRGVSPWCKVFTHEEWLHYEYARDLLHFYRAGPGNPYAGAMGWLWLNATSEQLVNNSATGIYHSFVHDGDIIPLLATIGFMDEAGDDQFLPTDRIKHDRRWKTSDVVPMGGRLVFERVDCMGKDLDLGPTVSYVRLIVNDGLFDLRQFIQGDGIACAVEINQFQRWVSQKGINVGDFREKCGIERHLPGGLSFLYQ